MAITNHCGRVCSDCSTSCRLDEMMPCSPDCQNLTKEGFIKVKNCLEEKCAEVKSIFDMKNASDKEVLEKYGEIAVYPFTL